MTAIFSGAHIREKNQSSLISSCKHMLPPFCCSPSTDMDGMKRQHQQRKHAMLSMWRDGVERQLSALNAAIDTLEKQMNRTSNQTD